MDRDRRPRRLTAPAPPVTRLLAPFDLFLQARDRSLLVSDPARAKALWPVIGRPGAVLAGGAIVGIWRPQQSGAKLRLHAQLWSKVQPSVCDAIAEQAERLAAHRNVRLIGVDMAD